MVHDLAANMKTVCMGRFVMRIPLDMSVTGDVRLYYGLTEDFNTVDVRIESLDSSPEAMKVQVAAEAQKIDKSDRNRKTGKSMLLDYKVLDDRMSYLRKHGAYVSAAGSVHELHLLVGKAQVLLSADSYEGVDEALGRTPDGKVETPDEVKARLIKVARQIHAYDDPEKAGPGFCLGPVVINSDQDNEMGDISLSTARYPDLSLTIWSNGLTPDSQETLLGNMKPWEAYSSVHVLRKGTPSLAGMEGQEWLARFTDEHDVKNLSFAAWSNRENPALIRLSLSISLDTGGQLPRGPNAGKYVDSSLTPDEGVALWDAIIGSIRLRPDAVEPGRHGSQSLR